MTTPSTNHRCGGRPTCPYSNMPWVETITCGIVMPCPSPASQRQERHTPERGHPASRGEGRRGLSGKMTVILHRTNTRTGHGDPVSAWPWICHRSSTRESEREQDEIALGTAREPELCRTKGHMIQSRISRGGQGVGGGGGRLAPRDSLSTSLESFSGKNLAMSRTAQKSHRPYFP